MLHDYNIVVFSKHKDFFYSFLKFLRFKKILCDPCLITSVEDLIIIKLPKIELIICDPETNESFIDFSFELLQNHTEFIPVVLLSSNKDWKDLRPSFICATTILDPVNMWETNWSTISKIKDRWINPCLKALISESTSSDILQMIGSNRWTAGVRFLSTKNDRNFKGCIFFKDGVPEYAWSTYEFGSKAVFEMLRLQTGMIEVVKDMDLLPLKNIYISLEEMLIANVIEADKNAQGEI